jgi:tetratricopeptide (TPR) repeat protein
MSTTPKFISLYTPSRTAPELLEAIFVQREKLADLSLGQLRDSAQSQGGNKYHLLFIGPRGSGKTHLVSILVHRLVNDKSLTDKLRIAWLAEDESSPAFFKFLLRICRALRGRYPTEFPDPPTADLHALSDDTRRANHLIQFLLKHLDGRTLLVVVENLDRVFHELKTEGQQKWRAFLQEHPVAATLATSQQLTEEMSKRDEPFFGFFQVEYLKPLSLNDATELLRKIASANNKDDLRVFLETSTGRSRIRAIRHLSGGSHRVYIALSEFLTRESLDDLVIAFNQLLDELTPYYQERLNSLPAQQREIVEYLCKCRQTTPVKDIARELFIAETTASSQLKQLRDSRYVITNVVGRESRYELAEPLMRLCIEVKENRGELVPLIVEFLRVWYDKDDCEEWLVKLPRDADTERKYLEAVLRDFADSKDNSHAELLLEEFESLSSEERREQFEEYSRDLETAKPTLRQRLRYARILLEAELPEASLKTLERILSLAPDRASFHGLKAQILNTLDRLLEAEEAFAKAEALGLNDAMAWKARGQNASELDRHEEAVAWFKRSLSLKPEDAATWAEMARSLFCLERIEDSLEATRRTLTLEPRQPLSQFLYATLLAVTGHPSEALTAVEEAIALDPEDGAGWGLKGLILSELGRFEESVEVFTHALVIDPNDADSLNYRGVAYAALGDSQSSLADLTRAVELSPNRVSLENLAASVARHGRWKEAFDLLGRGVREHLMRSPGQRWQLAGISFICAVLTSTTVRVVWKERLDTLIGLFAELDAFADLGALVLTSLRRFPRELLTGELLTGWVELWREFAQKYPKLEMPVRLYEVGIRYLQTQDERVLLDLLQEERKILRDSLGLKSPEDESEE